MKDKTEYSDIHINLLAEYDKDVPAIVYAEDSFGGPEAKTAHRLIHQGDVFNVEAVIDSKHDGLLVSDVDPEYLDNNIPIYGSYTTASKNHDPHVLLIGTAPLGGQLSGHLFKSVENALKQGVDVISGLFEYLSADDSLGQIASNSGATIHDIRQAPPKKALREADGRTRNIEANVVTVMGTDSVTGKGTTTYELYDAATSDDVDAAFVATGQTGIMTGSRYGIPTDTIPVEYAVGAIEDVVCVAAEDHDLVIVESQAALSHPYFVGDDILKGSNPDCVILADDPETTDYQYFDVPKSGVQSEISAIEAVVDTEVIALATQSREPHIEEQKHGLTTGNIVQAEGKTKIYRELSQYLDL